MTIPVMLVLSLLYLASLPLLLPSALLIDLVRSRRMASTRCVLFGLVFLLAESGGILAAGILWATHTLFFHDPGRFLRRNFDLQMWWTGTLYHAAVRLFSMPVEIEGSEATTGGPLLVFIRHTSVADTVLSAVWISRRQGMVLRYVLKEELLWDPCLDIVGNRLINCFVRRDAGERERAQEQVQELVSHLGPRDGVLIYPEGTRFTPARRERALQRLDRSDDSYLLDRARAFRHVLPPRLGGPLALLDANPGADVLFCAHSGLERATTLWDLLNGALVGAPLRMCFWRIPFAEIPAGRAARIDWLYRQWARLDDWVDRRANAPVASRPAA